MGIVKSAAKGLLIGYALAIMTRSNSRAVRALGRLGGLAIAPPAIRRLRRAV